MQFQLSHLRFRRLRPFVVALAMGALVLSAVTLAAPSAHAQPPASVRLGHFSPDTAAMDVYIVPLQGGPDQLVLPSLSYGQVSEYMSLAPAVYNFAMRPAGASLDEPAQLTLSASVEDSSAYTLAALGENKELESKLLNDDLTPPPAGQGNVRLIHASTRASSVDVRVATGPVLATGIGFADITGYAPVPAGEWRVQVSESGQSDPELEQSLVVQADTVNTVVVLDQEPDRLTLVSVVDAAGMGMQSRMGLQSVLPAGGIATGAGGTAPPPNDSRVPLSTSVAVVLGAGTVLVAMLGTSGRRRWRATAAD